MKHFKTLFLSTFLFLLLQSNAQLTFPHLAVLYDSPWTYKNLQLVPIRFEDTISYRDNTFPKKFTTLANAMQTKKVTIRENNFDGNVNVNVINIKNNSNEYIIVTDGDLLKGGKQDRMIAETKIIAPGKEVEYLSVYCIEKGRWDKRAKTFQYGGFANLGVRKAGDSSGVQQHVWKEIEKQFAQDSSRSETWPFLQISKKQSNKLPDYLDYFKKQFAQSDSLYAGFIVVSDSTIIGCDIFANEHLLASSFDHLINSYVESVVHPEKESVDAKNLVVSFSNKLLGSETSQKKFIEHHGKMFEYKNKPLHITAYGN
jgi:hypothetical protein